MDSTDGKQKISSSVLERFVSEAGPPEGFGGPEQLALKPWGTVVSVVPKDGIERAGKA